MNALNMFLYKQAWIYILLDEVAQPNFEVLFYKWVTRFLFSSIIYYAAIILTMLKFKASSSFREFDLEAHNAMWLQII